MIDVIVSLLFLIIQSKMSLVEKMSVPIIVLFNLSINELVGPERKYMFKSRE